MMKTSSQIIAGSERFGLVLFGDERQLQIVQPTIDADHREASRIFVNRSIALTVQRARHALRQAFGQAATQRALQY